MNTAAKETLAEDLDHEARMQQGLVLEVADLVYLDGDPRKDLGKVARIEGGRLYVTWPRGRTWIYPSADLVLVAS